MISRENELKQLSSLKTFMMLTVVLYHSCLAVSGNAWGGVQLSRHNLAFSRLAFWFNTFHIQVFTFASGYLFYYGRYKKGKYRQPKQDITRRAMRLIVPYVLVSILWAIPAKLLAYGFSWSIIIKDFALAIQPAQLWFLPMLFIVYLIGYFGSDLMMQNEKITLSVLYCAYVVSVFIKGHLPIGVFQIGNAVQYLIYYYLGFLYAKGELRTKINPGIWLLLSIAVTYGYLCLMEKIGMSLYLQSVLPFISVFGILACTGLSRLGHIERLQGKNAWKFLTQHSMGVFLFHQQVLYSTKRLFNLEAIPDLIYVLMNFSVALAAGLVISFGLKKIKVGRLILGEGRWHGSL